MRCAACSFDCPPGSRFCLACGARQRDYTPKHLSDRILRTRAAIEGERKQVTVLFADVQGSTQLSEQVGLEEWHEILDRFLRTLANGIHRLEGTVNQYEGDGIMALFGAPLACEDHAQRACYAALGLRDELRRFSDEIARSHGVEFPTRIGLNSGEVVVGKIGDDLRMDYTAQGLVVHLARRVEQLAEPGGICLAPATAALVHGYFTLKDLGEHALKGAAGLTRVHALVDAGSIRTRLDVARSRGLSTLVGRARELAALDQALALASEGRGQVVGVVGDAGVGKSRLCAEYLERVRAAGTRVYAAHCPSHGRTVPLLPVLELLRGWFDIGEFESDAGARTKVAEALSRLGTGLRAKLPLALDLLGIREPQGAQPPGDPDVQQRRLQAFLRELVQTAGRSEPLALFVDDAHWIDPASDAHLAQLAEAVRDTRALLLVNFRPDYSAEWMDSAHYQQLPLLPLRRDALDAMLRDLIGIDPSTSPLVALIRARTGGNPLFVEEVVRSLADAGSLVGRPGDYRLAQPVETLDVPSTVQPLIAARIDRLPEAQKQALETAAVIGERFSESLLARVAALEPSVLIGALSALCEAELIRASSLYPELEYTFAHPLVASVCYETQLANKRRRTHAEVARAIAAGQPHPVDARAALAARHWEAAGEAVEAAAAHLGAAQWIGFTDQASAVAHGRRILELFPDPRTEKELGLVMSAMTSLAPGGLRHVTLEEAEQLLARGREIASRGVGHSLFAALVRHVGAIRGEAGDLDGYRELASEAVALADESGHSASRVGARIGLAHSHLLSGRLRAALATIDEACALAPSGDSVRSRARIWTLFWRGLFLAELGHFESAERVLDESALRAQTEGLPGESSLHTSTLENARARIGLLKGAPELELAYRESPESDEHYILRGAGLVQAGRYEEALEALDLAAEQVRLSRREAQGEGPILADRARALAALGQGERAREAALRAVDATEQRGLRLLALDSQLALASVLRQVDGEAAGDQISRALERAGQLVEETGAASRAPCIEEERGRLARLRGEEEDAVRRLHAALRAYAALGATGHARRLARELGRA